MSLTNDKVTLISVSLTYSLRLREVIQRFGEPESVLALTAIGPDGSSYRLQIYYPERGLALEMRVKAEDEGELWPDMEVANIEYFVPGDLSNYIAARTSFGSPAESSSRGVQVILRDIQPWPGYGRVEVKKHR